MCETRARFPRTGPLNLSSIPSPVCVYLVIDECVVAVVVYRMWDVRVWGVGGGMCNGGGERDGWDNGRGDRDVGMDRQRRKPA